MLEPWAEISERLRRIHPNFKLRHYRLLSCVIVALSFAAYSYLSVSNGSTRVARRAGK
jgi:hypothetical protein